MDTSTARAPGLAVPGYPRGDTLTALFDARVRERPAAIAVVDGAVRLTYDELDRASGELATRLLAAGVGPGHRVPIVLSRSAEFVVSAVAVVRVGAAYAGVDADWPAKRLRRVTELLGAPVVIGRHRPPGIPAALPLLAPPSADEAAWPVTAPTVPVAGTDACVVTFTSGTTGEPKCIPLPHRGIVRLVDVTPLPPGPAPVSLHSCALPWDASLLEIWSALTRGGTCVVLREPYLTPAGLRRVVRDAGVDSITTPTSVFHLLVDEAVDCFAGLRVVMVGGEAMSPARARRFLSAHPGTTLLNLYGPSESSVATTIHPVRLADCDDPAGLPIGRPISHTGTHVRAGEHWCGPGEPGELLISGDGLALGYLGRPGTEPAAFAPVDLPDGTRTRAYRTGDLVQSDVDGLLRYLGRADRQVKVRGMRVEPAEVERAAADAPGVASCVVVPRPDPAGGYRDIVLFYLPREPGPGPAALLAHLADHLPAHVVPAAALAVTEYPLTAVGKVDEAALLALLGHPGADDPAAATGGPPLAAAGELVRTVFAEVLARPTVPPDEPVFALGATSLDAARICARLAERTGIPVSPARIAAAPTARALGDWLAHATARPAPGRRAGQTGAVRLTGSQAGFVLLHNWDPSDRSPLCPSVWAVDGGLDLPALTAALADLHRRHDALRHRYLLRNGQGVAEPVDVAAPRPEVLRADDREGALAALTTALTEPLDPSAGVVWRVVVACWGVDAALLGLCVHHVAYDGWSHGVLVADLTTAYAARLAGTAPAFPGPAAGLATQNAASHAAAARDGDPLARTELVGALRGIPDLPLPRPGRATDTIPSVVRPLPPSVLDAIAAAARAAGVAPLTVWLTEYGEALAELTGARDFGVGVPVAGRTGAALSDCVGCAIGTVCVRLTPGRPEEERLVVTGAAVRLAMSTQDIPVDEVVRLVNPRRSTRPPLYQTVFALQNVPYRELRLPGAVVHPHRAALVRPMLELETQVFVSGGDGVHLVVTGHPRATTPGLVEDLAGQLAARMSALAR